MSLSPETIENLEAMSEAIRPAAASSEQVERFDNAWARALTEFDAMRLVFLPRRTDPVDLMRCGPS